jgi:hypothetical protein
MGIFLEEGHKLVLVQVIQPLNGGAINKMTTPVIDVVSKVSVMKTPESKRIHRADPAPDIREKARKSPQNGGVPGQGV